MSSSSGLVASMPQPTYFPLEIAVPDEVQTRVSAPLTEDERLNGEIPKRCVRCSVLYKCSDDTNVACGVHNGTLIDYQSLPAYWTCCRKLKNEEGCVKTFHLEDLNTREKLLQYSLLTSQAESRRTITNNMLPSGVIDLEAPKRRVVRADNEPKNGVIIHTVLGTDTLDGISLKYEINKSEIIKANRGLSTANFPAYRKILIPVGDADIILTDFLSPEDKRKLEEEKLRIRFAREFKLSSEEATAYLSTHDYNYQLASQDFQDDAAFEKALPQKSSKTNAPFASRTTKFTPLPSSSPKPSSPHATTKK